MQKKIGVMCHGLWVYHGDISRIHVGGIWWGISPTDPTNQWLDVRKTFANLFSHSHTERRPMNAWHVCGGDDLQEHNGLFPVEFPGCPARLFPALHPILGSRDLPSPGNLVFTRPYKFIQNHVYRYRP